MELGVENVIAKKKNRHCYVPRCKNTTVKTPNLKFFAIPSNATGKRRKMWIAACRREPISDKTTGFICEEHFNVSVYFIIIYVLAILCTYNLIKALKTLHTLNIDRSYYLELCSFTWLSKKCCRLYAYLKK